MLFTSMSCISGASPRPQGRLRRSLGRNMLFREAEQCFLLLFLEKEGCQLMSCISGASPRPQGRLRRSLGRNMLFREGEQCFLLLFLEKEENISDRGCLWVRLFPIKKL
jgi:hypothetical protein